MAVQANADNQAVRNSLRNSHCHATHITFCTQPLAHRSLVQTPLANLARCSHRTSSANKVRITLSHLREIGPNPGKGRHKLPQLDHRYLRTLRRLLPEQRIRRLLLLIR